MEGTGREPVGGAQSAGPEDCSPLSPVAPPDAADGDVGPTAELRPPHRRRDADSRAERIAQIQAEIAAGVYETPEKLDIAIERLLRKLG